MPIQKQNDRIMSRAAFRNITAHALAELITGGRGIYKGNPGRGVTKSLEAAAALVGRHFINMAKQFKRVY